MCNHKSLCQFVRYSYVRRAPGVLTYSRSNAGVYWDNDGQKEGSWG